MKSSADQRVPICSLRPSAPSRFSFSSSRFLFLKSEVHLYLQSVYAVRLHQDKKCNELRRTGTQRYPPTYQTLSNLIKFHFTLCLKQL